MLSKIKKFFDEQFTNVESDSRTLEEKMNLASAVLLMEIAYSDSNFSDIEKETLKKLLISKFSIPQSLIDELVNLAEHETKESNSMFEFTSLINRFFESEQKFQLVKSMWTIAYADKKLDSFEEYMIRKIADLLYVSHSDFIRAKVQVQEESEIIRRIR